MNLVDHFVSIQGEGQNTGINTLFIRLFGCNLECDFCDEPKHRNSALKEHWTIEQIVDLAQLHKTEWICITGGEPTLQDLRPLIGALQAVGNKVQVETNGHNLYSCSGADLITLSPKGDKIPPGPWDEVKILIPVQEELLRYTRGRVYLQPVNGVNTINYENVQRCLDLLKQYPTYGLSLQLHKVIGCD